MTAAAIPSHSSDALGRYVTISGGQYGGKKGWVVDVERGPVTGIPVFIVSVAFGGNLFRLDVLGRNLFPLPMDENHNKDHWRATP